MTRSPETADRKADILAAEAARLKLELIEVGSELSPAEYYADYYATIRSRFLVDDARRSPR